MTTKTHFSQSLDKNDISPHALKVLKRLETNGYESYLVGGGVRDMLLGLTPTDFDVVTNAKPQEIRRLFRNSRLIGRRFRLVHVYFPGEIIEVSTFRANAQEKSFLPDKNVEASDIQYPDILSEDNTYGTIEEDSWRRDFTINALYYHIPTETIIDFTGGLSDLKKRIVCIIGDPLQRYHEDPVRLLRAIRLAAKLNFKIDEKAYQYLLELPHLLHHVPSTRLFEEIIKLFFTGHATASFNLLLTTGYLKHLFPHALKALNGRKNFKKLIDKSIEKTDHRYAKNLTLNPGFLFSILLWPLVQQLLDEARSQNKTGFYLLHHSMRTAIQLQRETLCIPQRMAVMMRSVWTLQYHLERRRPSRIQWILRQRYFRAAVDFLELRDESGESKLKECVSWWLKLRDGNKKQRHSLIEGLKQK